MTITLPQKQFRSSYAGEVQYCIDRILYSARYWAPVEFNWNGDYFETGIKPSIGCVRFNDSARWEEFPPAEVMELFPGFVALRLVYHRADNLPVTHPDHQIGTMEYIHESDRGALVTHPSVPSYLTCETLVREGIVQ